MGIYTIEHGYQTGGRLRRRIALLFVVGTFGLGGYFVYQPARSATDTDTTHAAVKGVAEASPPQPKITTPMPWPAYGQAAYGVVEKGVLADSTGDNQTAVPIASLAKVITALAILEKKPLKAGEQGPMITLDDEDVALYGDYIRKDGSVVPVEAGEQISQYQAMQAMLLPSANNLADSLVRWAFGSVEAYTVYANTMVKDKGLLKTSVADASGFSASTVSTAHDMVQLGALYMKQPVLVSIATETEAKIPVAGMIRNYNSVINKDGILGIKVGNTDEAGRCFLVADIRTRDQRIEVISIVAVVGAPHLQTAMDDAKAILEAGNNGYSQLVRQ